MEEREKELAKAEEEIQEPNLSEIIKGKKTVTLPKYGEVELSRPSFHIIASGDKISATTKAKLLKDRDNEYLTTSELKKIYQARGSWTDEDEAVFDALREKIILIKNELRQEGEEKYSMESAGSWIDEEDKETQELCKIAYIDYSGDLKESQAVKDYQSKRLKKLSEYRKKYNELKDIHNELFGNTIESFANYEKQIYFCIMCYKKDGKYVWNSMDEFKAESVDVFAEAISAAVKYWNGLDSEEMQSFFGELLEG